MNASSVLVFGGGGGVYVAIFWIVFVVWHAMEFAVNARHRSKSPQGRDRGSYRLLLVGISVGFTIAFASPFLLPALAIPWPRTAFASGMGLVIAGMALRLFAVVTLGRHFTVDVAVNPAQTVIDQGPYRSIRHPAYAGMLLSLTGFALALGNWAGVAAMLVFSGAAFAYRIYVEEAVLLATLGEPYKGYMERTQRLIPFVL